MPESSLLKSVPGTRFEAVHKQGINSPSAFSPLVEALSFSLLSHSPCHRHYSHLLFEWFLFPHLAGSTPPSFSSPPSPSPPARPTPTRQWSTRPTRPQSLATAHSDSTICLCPRSRLLLTPTPTGPKRWSSSSTCLGSRNPTCPLGDLVSSKNTLAAGSWAVVHRFRSGRQRRPTHAAASWTWCVWIRPTTAPASALEATFCFQLRASRVPEVCFTRSNVLLFIKRY